MIAGIVLAAGMSTRMGAFKQLLPLDERTVIEVVVERIVSRLEQLFVVLGHRADEVEEVLKGYPVECVYNPDYRLGMLSSVQCGIRAAGEAQAYLICLGDQPGIELGAIDAVLGGAVEAGEGIIIPSYRGKRGHPIVIRRSYRREILSLPKESGLNQVTRGYPEDTLEIPVADEQILRDMDTPADYRREIARYPRV